MTICTNNQENLFGEIQNKKIKLSRIGKIVEKFWKEIPKHFPFVKLDQFMMMPSHLHGILIINNTSVGTPRPRPVGTPQWGVPTKNIKKQIRKSNHKPEWKPNSLGSIINQFKSVCTKKIRKEYPWIGTVWQSRFYDRVIRNKSEFNHIQNYILSNPENWENDAKNI